MKKIFSLIFVLCLAFTGIMFVGCKDKDYLYKIDGVEIESVEIDRNDITGDFILEIELENNTKSSKDFDFTLIKLKVNNDDSKILNVLNLNKQSISAKADRDFTFILDEEEINVYGVTIGTSVSIYYANDLIATILVED